MFRQRYGKYKSTRQECQKGHWHHSKFEAGKCDELRLREIAGDIKSYEIQKRVNLYLGGVFMGTMVPDFYIEHPDGTHEFLETKGSHLMREFRFKRNWALLQEMYKDSPETKFTIEVCR